MIVVNSNVVSIGIEVSFYILIENLWVNTQKNETSGWYGNFVVF